MDILPYEGRVARARFAIGAVLCWVAFVGGLFGGFVAMFGLLPDVAADFVKDNPQDAAYVPRHVPWAVAAALAPVCALAVLLAPFSWISLCIGRLHDLGCPAWTVLLLLFVVWAAPQDSGALFVNGALMLIPGTAGDNRYGADPRVAPA